MKRAAKIVGYTLLGLVVLVLNVVAAGFIYLKTNHAREHLLAFGLKKLNVNIPGGAKVARSEGDLTKGLVLYDVEIDDLDGKPAVMIDRLELRYSLLQALVTHVQVDRVGVQGLTVVSRPLDDGRDNLATLTTFPPPKGPIPKLIPVSVTLADVDVAARFVRLGPGGTIEHVARDKDVRASLHLRADLSRGMVASIESFTLETQTPAIAKVTMQGGVHIAEKMDVRHVHVTVEGDTTQLRRKVEKLELSGPALVIVDANGPQDDLVASVSANTTQPKVVAELQAHVFGDRAELKTLSVEAPFAHVKADGVYRFDKTGRGNVHVASEDLSGFELFGAPPMSGSMKIDAEGSRTHEHTKLRAKGDVQKLRIANNRIKAIDLDVDLEDLDGRAIVSANDLQLGKTRLNTFKLDANGNPTEAHLVAQAKGDEGLDLDLKVDALPKMRGKKLLSVDATLGKLHFRGGGRPWELAHPARLTADLEAKKLALVGLEMVNDKQKITAEGSVQGSTIQHASLVVEHFDLKELAAAISPGHVMPHTDFNVAAEAHGDVSEPSVGVKFDGRIDGNTDHDLIHATTNGEAMWKNSRLNGKVFATIGGQKVSAKGDIPLPLAPDEKLDVSFDASVLLFPWFADLLVPKLIQSQPIIMYALGAKATMQGSIDGTTSSPHISASSRLARWGAGTGHGDVGVSLEYKNRQLSLSGRAKFSSLPQGGGSGAGVLEATAQLPIDLAPAFSGEAASGIDPTAAWHGNMKLEHLGIEYMPFDAFGIVPPVNRGWVDGTIELGGTEKKPLVTATLDARGLNYQGLADIDVVGSIKVAGHETTSDLQISVHGSQAFHLKGSIGGDKDAAFDWNKQSLAFTLNSDGFDLGRTNALKGLDGNLKTSIKLTGTVEHPVANGSLSIDGLTVGPIKYKRFGMKGAIVADIVSGDFEMLQDSGARLGGTIRYPLKAGPVTGQIDAETFVIDAASELLPELRRVRGQLDGKITLGGTAKVPSVAGTFKIVNGELALERSAITYRNASVELGFSPTAIALRALKFDVGTDGTATGTGTISLKDLAPQVLTAKIALKHCAVEREGVAGYIDADIAVEGAKSDTGRFVTKLRIERGAAQINDKAKNLLPMGKLEDVKIAGARPAPIEEPVKVKPQDLPRFAATLGGPVTIKGGELDVVAKGDVVFDVANELPRAKGTLVLDPRSTVKLFGQPYTVEHAKVTFNGDKPPTYDVRISRQAAKARIGVDVGGPEATATTTFWSEPAVYDAAQVAAFILGGDAGTKEISVDKLKKDAPGPLSAHVARVVGDNLLARLRHETAH